MVVLDVQDPAWAAFVTRHPAATCFHRPEWSRLLAECYGFRSFVLAQRDQRGALVAGMPVMSVRALSGRRRWVCLPFSDECPPLVGPAGSLPELLRSADAARRQAAVAHLEVRAGVDPAVTGGEPAAVTHELAVPSDPGELHRRLRAAVRRHIAKAGRLGVSVRAAERPKDMQRFYDLHVGTRRRQGVPVQPRRYFRLLWERMIEPGLGFLLLAEHDGTAVAAAVFLTGGRTVTYKYGASDQASWSLSPNHALHWRALTWAAEHGYTTYDWGRSDAADHGLRRFKDSWGAVERPLRYTHLADGPVGASKERASSLLRPVIAHSPAFVCRGVGELLYRFAA